ncbi:uncharacterized protein LOC118193466 isoform X2 [Stegodyphus dumicola]|uniref:uncharacterized protein LOC118193466 isoform X2 n=1 Tax=Stegodyphus dumicola TaxID=202533 RepID=UPI0015A7D772|nr:uncharacterized protein LOC118193466 isoform X2 [Stegodyphus dumicola]
MNCCSSKQKANSIYLPAFDQDVTIIRKQVAILSKKPRRTYKVFFEELELDLPFDKLWKPWRLTLQGEDSLSLQVSLHRIPRTKVL